MYYNVYKNGKLIDKVRYLYLFKRMLKKDPTLTLTHRRKEGGRIIEKVDYMGKINPKQGEIKTDPNLPDLNGKTILEKIEELKAEPIRGRIL